MSDYLLIFLSTVLVNNFVLIKLLDLCPFISVSTRLETALSMGLATTFILTLSSICSYLVNEYLLIPLNLEILHTITLILIIIVVIQLTEIAVYKTNTVLYQTLGVFSPLVITNCAVLGVTLLNIQEKPNLITSALYGFSAAIGFSLVLILFAAMCERIAVADVPEVFRGAPIVLITAGIMAMAFMGFTGLVKI